jgi:hypothetical protein
MLLRTRSPIVPPCRRRGYLEGTPKWYLGVAKFCNHVLSSVLEEAGLR